MKTVYLVVETCDDYEQILSCNTDPRLPTGGVLNWPDSSIWGEKAPKNRASFTTKADARRAIRRTGFFAAAYSMQELLPQPAFCKVVAVDVAGT